jgi:hypothetical protein
MSTVRIPLASDTPFFSLRATLEGVEYLFTFRYVQRLDRWYFDLALAADGTPIWSGIKLICNWDLLGRCVSNTRPPGSLLAVGEGSPGFSEIGQGRRVQLVYIESTP